ncbi:MAG TPA: Calx-beta domain-containing protein, partial [Thermoanaerobaculia bacterium]
IGGTTAAARNVISSNGSAGIFIIGDSPGTVIRGNFIGTDAAGTASRGNAQDGVAAIAAGVQIGGSAAGAGNTIAFNTGSGVFVSGPTTTGVTISRNSITANGSTGINFGFGPNVNDPGDTDTGPNNLQNSPVLTSAVLGSGNTTVTGTLNSTASTMFTIEIFDNAACDSLGFGEGAVFGAATNVTTDAMGNAAFSVVVPIAMTVATATATDPAGNTSQFSNCAATATLSINDITVTEGTGGTTTATFTVTRTPAVAATSTVQFATANGTAIAPGDYATTSGTLTFNPGDATKTIAVNVVADNIDESNENFVVNLSNATGASISDAQGVATITDDDTSTIAIADAATVFEGSPAMFTVTLSTPSATSITVNFATADNTATAPGDYTATSGVLTFAPGEVSKTISVPTLIDTTLETNETFFVNLTSTSTITRAQALGTIADIANVPTLSQWMLLLLAMALAVLGLGRNLGSDPS